MIRQTLLHTLLIFSILASVALTKSSDGITSQKPTTVSASKTLGPASSSMTWWATQTGASNYGDGDTCPNGLNNYGHPLRPSMIEPEEWYFDPSDGKYWVVYTTRIKQDPKISEQDMRLYNGNGEMVAKRSGGSPETTWEVAVEPNRWGGTLTAPSLHMVFTYSYYYSMSYHPNECEMSGNSEPVTWDISTSN